MSFLLFSARVSASAESVGRVASRASDEARREGGVGRAAHGGPVALPFARWLLVLWCSAIYAGGWVTSLQAADGVLPTSVATTPGIGVEAVPGREVAERHCSVCHLFPEPDLLDQATWLNGALRRMAPLLGVARLNFDTHPDGAVLRESGLFPTRPVMPEAEWRAIVGYYRQAAPARALPADPRPPVAVGRGPFRVEAVTNELVSPAVTLVHVDAARRQVLLGDGREPGLHVLDASGRRIGGLALESPPVAITREGPTNYLTLIGRIFPSEATAGQVVRWIEGSDGGPDRIQPVLTGLRRPVHCLVGDLDRDGRRDFVVAEYGNYLGRLAWYEDRAGKGFVPHALLDNPGASRVVPIDVDGDGRQELLVLYAQARDGIYLFRQWEEVDQAPETWIQFPPIYGVTWFELADFNGDGAPDILTVNGDNGEYASPYKRYHGLRIFLNDGRNRFREAWFHHLDGAFKAVARDFDGDGDLDLVAMSFFPDFGREPVEGILYLENRGGLRFDAVALPEGIEGRWLTMDAGDVDGDGDIDVVLGSFVDGPRATPVPESIEMRWAGGKTSALLLRNRTR